MGIGISFKTHPSFGKFSDPRVTFRPQRFSQNWVRGGRWLSQMGNCSSITGSSGVANTRPCKVQEVPVGS